jgi:hypothetical protein
MGFATIPLKNSGKVACMLRNLKIFSDKLKMRPNLFKKERAENINHPIRPE